MKHFILNQSRKTKQNTSKTRERGMVLQKGISDTSQRSEKREKISIIRSLRNVRDIKALRYSAAALTAAKRLWQRLSGLRL